MKSYKLIFLLPVISIHHFEVEKNNHSSHHEHSIVSGNRKVAEYEVKLTHTGYVAFSGGLQDCPIRSNGKVVLTGLLKGEENVDPADAVRRGWRTAKTNYAA